MNIFDTRVMLDALEELKEPASFFKKMFFKNIKTFDARFVEVDLFKGKRRVAAYVKRISDGQNVEKEGYKTTTFEPPYLAPYMVDKAGEFFKKGIGQNPYAVDPEQRAMEQLARELVQLDNMITRVEELQAIEALFDGKITVKDIDGNPLQEQIDFNRSAGHEFDLSASDPWTDQDADIIGQIRTAARKNLQDSGIASNIVVMGTAASEAFLKNNGIKDMLIQNFNSPDVGKLVVEAQNMGVTYIGSLFGMQIYELADWYYNNDTETEVSSINEKTVLVGSTLAQTTLAYAAIEDVDEPFGIDRFPKVFTNNAKTKRFIRLDSSPLAIPTQVDAFSKIITMS